MASTQKSTQIAPRDVLTINAGLHVLRRILRELVPSDFEWSVRFEEDSVAFFWVWIGAGGVRYQEEQRAPTLADLLDLVECINWRAEREAAKRAEGQS